MVDDDISISVHMKRLISTGSQLIIATCKCWPCIGTFFVIFLFIFKFITLYFDIISNIEKKVQKWFKEVSLLFNKIHQFIIFLYL